MTDRGVTASELVAIALEWVNAHRLPDADPSLTILPTTDLFETGVLDSFAFVELVAFLEARAGRSPDLLALEPEVFATLDGLCGAFVSPVGHARTT